MSLTAVMKNIEFPALLTSDCEGFYLHVDVAEHHRIIVKEDATSRRYVVSLFKKDGGLVMFRDELDVEGAIDAVNELSAIDTLEKAQAAGHKARVVDDTRSSLECYLHEIDAYLDLFEWQPPYPDVNRVAWFVGKSRNLHELDFADPSAAETFALYVGIVYGMALGQGIDVAELLERHGLQDFRVGS